MGKTLSRLPNANRAAPADFEAGESSLQSQSDAASLQSQSDAASLQLQDIEQLVEQNRTLSTLVDDQQLAILELTALTEDLEIVFETSEIAKVILDADCRITRFNPSAGRILGLATSDQGASLKDVSIDPSFSSIAVYARRVLLCETPHKGRIRGTGGRSYLLRMKPYR